MPHSFKVPSVLLPGGGGTFSKCSGISPPPEAMKPNWVSVSVYVTMNQARSLEGGAVRDIAYC